MLSRLKTQTYMEKEANGGIWQPCTQHLGHQHKMIIINPHHVAIPILTDNNVRKGLVHRDVILPSGLVEVAGFGVVVDLVVERLPEHLIC